VSRAAQTVPSPPLGAERTATPRVTVVLSVPFVRNARFLLSSSAYHRLQREFDVVIVSPFANTPAFRDEFGGPNTSFVMSAKPRGWLRMRLFALTETIRFMGFWYRNRATTTAQYWAEARGRGLSGWLRVLISAISAPPWVWRLFERWLGRWMYDVRSLDAAVTGPAVTVLTANWGYESRLLAHWSACRDVPRVLLPYTTDQITINGHLIADFDAICAQGAVERDCATALHGVPPSRIIALGNIWFRNIDRWRERVAPYGGRPRPRLVYAGVASQYFPKDSEWAAIEALVEGAGNGTLPPCEVFYRPIATQDELGNIRRRCDAASGVTLQAPEAVMFSMQGYGDCHTSIAAQIDGYLSDLASADVFLMSMTTTMALDALYLDIPVVANFSNLEISPARRRAHPRLTHDPVGLLDSGIAVVVDPQDLVGAVGDALQRGHAHRQARSLTLERWDADPGDWEGTLVGLLQSLSARATTR
jgi:hypothetical protein